jgi:hypothetical protein
VCVYMLVTAGSEETLRKLGFYVAYIGIVQFYVFLLLSTFSNSVAQPVGTAKPFAGVSQFSSDVRTKDA